MPFKQQADLIISLIFGSRSSCPLKTYKIIFIFRLLLEKYFVIVHFHKNIRSDGEIVKYVCICLESHFFHPVKKL